MRDNVSGNPPSPTYHPSHEFPGGDEGSSHPGFHTYTESTRTPSNDFPICRLVIQEGRFISQKRRLAVIDGYSEVQFGRDVAPPGVSTPRIRLRDMEVSKLHATLFWDTERSEWAVVDMGSKHGTFVGSVHGTDRVRLSASRVASMPRRLKHLDRLSLGGTTFVVHIHENRLPCSDCSASGQGSDNLIPLFYHQRDSGTASQAERSLKRGADSSDDVPRNAKRALSSLKRSLLSRPGGFFPTESPQGEPVRPSNHGVVQRCRSSAPDTTGPHQESSPSPHVADKGTATITRERSRFTSTNIGRLPMKQVEEGGMSELPGKGDRA
ncbi:hypothetical protein BJV74DRAFT_842485 [Russula compacta]|nr:hypothetical protein BJV74DRAFT_842485 [Russula compacta]